MKKLLLISILFLSLGSCRKWLEIYPEGVQLEENAVKTQADLGLILVSCYDAMANHYNGRVQFFNELMGDNLEKPQSGFTVPIYLRTTNYFNSDVAGLYGDLYNVVFRLNYILLRMEDGTIVVDNAFKTRVTAEVKFLRAMIYFDLVRIWAQPIGTTADNSHLGVVIRKLPETTPKARGTVAENYNLILTDLGDAINNLPPSNGNYATQDAAKALLAKVYFQMNDYAKVKDVCNELIPKYTMDTTLNRFVNALNSSEKIFSFVSTGTGDNRAAAYINNYRFLNTTNPSPIRMSKSLYLEATADTLDRRSKFYVIYNQGSSAETYCISKFNYDFLSNPISYLTQLKLMRAEALAILGSDLSTAIGDVNDVIERAYGNQNNNLPTNTIAPDVILVVRKQRRLEFPMEGARVQDLKRIGVKEDPAGSGSVLIRNSKWNCPGLALQFPVNENTSVFKFNPEGGCE
ncbi:MAG: RagB/SusD family nutrient uptake outer membrane protein [bacterium]|nr:RagB/SusD family nutrient uptake outer membrane protein [bacterium]